MQRSNVYRSPPTLPEQRREGACRRTAGSARGARTPLAGAVGKREPGVGYVGPLGAGGNREWPVGWGVFGGMRVPVGGWAVVDGAGLRGGSAGGGREGKGGLRGARWEAHRGRRGRWAMG